MSAKHSVGDKVGIKAVRSNGARQFDGKVGTIIGIHPLKTPYSTHIVWVEIGVPKATDLRYNAPQFKHYPDTAICVWNDEVLTAPEFIAHKILTT